MGMATLQFYRNPYLYPDYGNITPYGNPMDCTPVGVDLRTGTLRVKGNMADFMSCNYLALTRDGQTLYAWIDNVRFRTEDSFEVTYTVDAWRTYRNKIRLGTQFIARQPHPTFKKDDLLGSSRHYHEIKSQPLPNANEHKRVFVVQVRAMTGELMSNTPVQPTNYRFYMVEYDVRNWQATQALDNLMTVLANNAEASNLVTMYSLPYMQLSGLPTDTLFIHVGDTTIGVQGFKMLTTQQGVNEMLSIEYPVYLDEDVNELMRVEHSVQLVIPDAGIINIPDELLHLPDLRVRQDIDLFSGASNYMLVSGGDGTEKQYYNLSVRGSSIASIPILSDPMDTYLSQNQNALATSLIGDVATIAGGVAMMGTGAGAVAGAGTAMGGITGIINKYEQLNNIASSYSNPPAYLGTAMANNFTNHMWLVITKQHVDNAELVNENFGYPINKIGTLTFPESGYIKTEGCNVSSVDGSVPRWAIEEINQNFDRGIFVH